MRLGIAALHQPIAHLFGKWDVNEPITMNMPYLSLSEPVRCSSKAMWPFRHTSPSLYRLADCLVSSSNCHNDSLYSL